jgi:hypothetical protein
MAVLFLLDNSETFAIKPAQPLDSSRRRWGFGDHEPLALMMIGGVGLGVLCLVAGPVIGETGVTRIPLF